MERLTFKKNLTSGIIGLAFGAVMWFAIPYCIKSKITMVSSNIGPDYLPKLVAIVMIVCGIGLIFQSLVLKKDETVEVEFSKEGRAMLFALAMIIYVVVLPYAGFVIASGLFACVSLFLMECRKKLYYLYAILLVLVIFAAFKYGLSVALPTLIL